MRGSLRDIIQGDPTYSIPTLSQPEADDPPLGPAASENQNDFNTRVDENVNLNASRGTAAVSVT